MLVVDYGYLETPYLSEFPYLEGAQEVRMGVQFQIQTETALGSEFLTAKKQNLGSQFLTADQKALLSQFEVKKEKSLATQFNTASDLFLGSQFRSNVIVNTPMGIQFKPKFENGQKKTALEFRGAIPSSPDKNKQGFTHFDCPGGGYLNEFPYLEESLYLVPFNCVAFGAQWRVVQQKPLGTQFRAVIYNTTNLRILIDFPSRGTTVTGGPNNAWSQPSGTGKNWIATSTQASSSNGFSPYNMNTDVVEQYWRSADGVKSATITCDTEITQGVFVDTLAFINHNLTGGATVTMQSSNVSDFSTIEQAVTLSVTRKDMYWIAPTLPLVAYRYWRFIINDPGNPDNFVRVGTVVFGSAIIFSNESFVDRVRYGQKQFVDQVYTEGFTNVSNDRGKKKFLELDFKNLIYDRQNFQSMRSVFDQAGITLKCLWIPLPQQPTRFSLFAKLTEIPSEEHNYKAADADYVDFSIRLDESL